jgi:hypothetical protein
MDLTDSGECPSVGDCEYGNESSGCIKGSEFRKQVSDCQLIKDMAVTL